ncbi:phage tail length tape measure family protein, partial [Ruixingdingia sedimenti]
STAATLRHGQALDDLRARFNPLFAVSRAYEQELRDIADAERQGAITSREAAAARERAAQVMAPGSAGGGGTGAAGSGLARGLATNLSFQMNDIAMMTAMGQSPFMLMIQQGPQVAQIFSQLKESGLSLGATLSRAFGMVLTSWGLLAMGVIGGGAALVQWMMRAAGGAKTLEERMDELGGAFDRYRRFSDIARASSADLVRQFGASAEGARGLYEVLLDLGQLSLDQKLKNTATAAREMMGMMSPSAAGRGFTGFFGLGTGAAHVSAHSSDIAGFQDTLKRFETTEGTDDQIAGLQAVLELVRQYATLKGGITDQEQALIDLLQKQGDVLLGIKAAETARTEARRLQLDQMSREQAQQTELAIATRMYGENAVAVEVLRANHARAALETRLQEMGIEKNSAEAARQRGVLEARLRAEAELSASKRKKAGGDIIADLNRQTEVSQAILLHGEDAAQVELVRERHARELLGARTLEAGLGWV